MRSHPLTLRIFLKIFSLCYIWTTVSILISSAHGGGAIDVEDLKPGLVAEISDGTTTVSNLQPSVVVFLGKGESFHPQLSGERGTAQWKGYLNLLRKGEYQFSAQLLGQVTVSVAGKNVLKAEVKGDKAERKTGPKTELPAGIQPITVEFTRVPGSARLELLWDGPDFLKGPLSHNFLYHLGSKASAKLEPYHQSDLGRFLVEEHSCVSCHSPNKHAVAKTLTSRRGPNLSNVGERIYPGWIYHWLQNPHEVYPDAVMPKLFGTDEVGKAEAYAVAKYLSVLGDTLQEQPGQLEKASVDRGRILYSSVGCLACHGDPFSDANAEEQKLSFYQLPKQFSLKGIVGKTHPRKLAEYLQNPHRTDPSGRMPSLLLNAKEARDIANYLCGGKTGVADTARMKLPEEPANAMILKAFENLKPPAEDVPRFKNLSAEEKILTLGKRLIENRNCTACHELKFKDIAVKPRLAKASFSDICNPQSAKSGCLSANKELCGTAPKFVISPSAGKAIVRFLSSGTKGIGSIAPTYQARVTMQRFRCLSCHDRHGEGGLTDDVIEQLKKYEKAENAESILPPQLTGVGHKLRSSWLEEVLLKGGRARPWMALRMPQFGKEHVGNLPEALAHLEGIEPYDKLDKVNMSNENLAAGRFLLGKSGFGCISCHDIAGVPNFGTRGPDLATTNQRVRYDWYRRWMQQSQRMDPGTKMPTAFPDGASPLLSVLAGNADAQAEAIWAYMSLGPKMPLPEGVQKTQPGLNLIVKDRPIMLRTFMPGSGTKAIATGYPAGVSLTFDAQKCRLAYAWKGDFLNVARVWNNRGGAPAQLLGPKLMTFPSGNPWALTVDKTAPDLVKRGEDPAFGANLPEGQVFLGDAKLFFRGYGKDKLGQPTFRYDIDSPSEKTLKVAEKPMPLVSSNGIGLSRTFVVDVPEKGNLWFLVQATNAAPKVIDFNGEIPREDLVKGEFPATKFAIVIPEGNQPLVYRVADAKSWQWHMHKVGGTWHVFLRQTATPGQTQLQLNVWSPYENETTAWKSLLKE